MTDLPVAARPGPPASADLARWHAADEAARPARLERLRALLDAEGLDAYLGLSRENTRYLTGFVLGEGEEKVAGDSGRFLVSRDELIVLADSRYREQAEDECPGARIEESYYDLPDRWAALVASLRAREGGPVRRVAAEASLVSRALWGQLEAAAPGVELVEAGGWVEQLRATKEPSELERVAAACAVADAALQRVLPILRAGLPERDAALQLEWEMRTHGAEALAFDVTCLSGPRAALPHGSPGDRPHVIPKGWWNLAFAGQFCELADDTVFTVEYSIRSAQTAVYSLLQLDKAPHAVYKGHHNPIVLYRAFMSLQR